MSETAGDDVTVMVGDQGAKRVKENVVERDRHDTVEMTRDVVAKMAGDEADKNTR